MLCGGDLTVVPPVTKRAPVFQSIVTVAAIRLWLRGWVHCLRAGRRLSPFSGMIFTSDVRP